MLALYFINFFMSIHSFLLLKSSKTTTVESSLDWDTFGSRENTLEEYVHYFILVNYLQLSLYPLLKQLKPNFCNIIIDPNILLILTQD